MGVFWESFAEVVSQEPESIKLLIEAISEEKFKHPDYADTTLQTTGCYKLTVKDNSVFFTSSGYGCFGNNLVDDGSAQLFEKLFERYTGALIAFEHVHPCQNQGYHFNSLWSKPEGDVDWNDEETFFIFRRMVCEGSELDETDFDVGDCWYTSLELLEGQKENAPHLYNFIQKAKEEGFEAWGQGAIGDADEENFISTDILYEILDQYCTDDDQLFLITDDQTFLMIDWIQYPDDIDAQFEMPENFPDLQLYLLKREDIQ
jgi:hypothetical protein